WAASARAGATRASYGSLTTTPTATWTAWTWPSSTSAAGANPKRPWETVRKNKAAGGVLTAKQAPHRPGIAPALGLRAGLMAFSFYRKNDGELSMKCLTYRQAVWACLFGLALLVISSTQAPTPPEQGVCCPICGSHRTHSEDHRPWGCPDCAYVRGLAFAGDALIVATRGGPARQDEMVELRLWDAASGRQRAVLAGHLGGIAVVAFAPDGRLVATEGYDQTVRVWGVASGQENTLLCGAMSDNCPLAFAPAGGLSWRGGGRRPDC